MSNTIVMKIQYDLVVSVGGIRDSSWINIHSECEKQKLTVPFLLDFDHFQMFIYIIYIKLLESRLEQPFPLMVFIDVNRMDQSKVREIVNTYNHKINPSLFYTIH